jgi:tetratricopeptide (TPR) repeat protein
MKNEWKIFVGVCALVVGVYASMAHWSVLGLPGSDAADTPYNLLVRGFRAGQLSLKEEVPLAFTRLADPYDPTANVHFRLGPNRFHDLSYYKGRLYLYFGVTPALILFWPFVAMTGHYLFDRQAVTIFCAIGFLSSVGLLRALWRRYFFEVSVWVVLACALALGLATGVPMLLPRSNTNEVAISCGYMLTMLALGAVWCALDEPERKWRWMAAASVAYGLAVGARPSLLFGAVILLVPLAHAWHEGRRIGGGLLAAMGPIMIIGLGLMLYNAQRFNNPFDFGEQCQLVGRRQVTQQFFSLHYLWFNFRVYFLEPARWTVRFPYAHEISPPLLPAGYDRIEDPFGILTNIPLVWLAAAVPLAWRGRSGPEASTLRWFATTTALLFGVCALTVGLYWSAIIRYEVDFLPALVLLAVIGILSLERTLADQPVWRRVARWGWSLLLAFSVAFNLLASVGYYAFVYNGLGNVSFVNSRVQEAIRLQERALRLNPDYAEAHNSLASELFAVGKVQEGSQHFERSLQIRPNWASTHNDWGNALAGSGKPADAIGQYQEALRLKPDYPDAHNNLGLALMSLGKPEEAIEHYEKALRINPDDATAHINLGNALSTQGRIADALRHYAEALRINPDDARAYYDLGLALALIGRVPEAMEQWEHALRLNPDYVQAHFNMGLALEKMGRTPEAIRQYQQALKLQPGFGPAKDALARLGAGQ